MRYSLRNATYFHVSGGDNYSESRFDVALLEIQK